MTLARGMVVVALAAALPAAGSAPCHLFQVRMDPPTGSTNVSAPVTVELEEVPYSEADLTVEDESGAAVSVPHERVDAGAWSSRTLIRISDFPEPGWYAIRVAVSHSKHESSDRSMLPTHVGAWGGRDEFRGELLVGRSEPGVRTLLARSGPAGTWVSLHYSELMQFPDASVPGVEVQDVDGNPLGCSQEAWLWPDGGLSDQVMYTCDGGVDSLVVKTPPVGLSGVAATFPEPGTRWKFGLPSASPPDAYINVLTDVRAKSLDNHTPTGLGASYEKCDQKYPRCGCASDEGTLVIAADLALAVWWLSRRRR